MGFIVQIVARYLLIFQQYLVEFISRARPQVKYGKIIHLLRSVVDRVRAFLREVFTDSAFTVTRESNPTLEFTESRFH